MAQKTVIFGATRILWAGSCLHSLIAIKAIGAATSEGQVFLDKESATKILQEAGVEIDSISLIYSHIADFQIHEWSLNCTSVSRNIEAAGTGLWDFFSNTALPGREDPNGEKDVFDSITINLLSKTARELFDPDYDFLYGGWFEQTGIKEWQFIKLPIAFKVWPIVDGEIQLGGPLFFSHYFDQHLAVCAFAPMQTPPGQIPQPRSQLIPDFLTRTHPPPDPYGMEFSPASITHVFVPLDKDGPFKRTCVMAENFVNGAGFEVSFYRGDRGQPRFGIDISDAYVSELKQRIDWTSPEMFSAPFTGGLSPNEANGKD